MSVRAFYPDVEVKPDYSFLGRFVGGFIDQRAAENAAVRKADGGDRDLGKLEIEVAKSLGRLQEAKGRGLSKQAIQNLKHDAELWKVIVSAHNNENTNRARIAAAQMGLQGDIYRSDTARTERNAAAMEFRQPGTMNTIASGVGSAAKIEDVNAANRAADTAIDAALHNEGVAVGDLGNALHDRVAFEAWKAATQAGNIEVANHIRGTRFNGADPTERMAAYGALSDEELVRRGRTRMSGGVRAFEYADELAEAARGGKPTTGTRAEATTEKGGADGAGRAPGSTRVRRQVGDVSIEEDIAAADSDPVARERLNDAFDAAIAEQQAMLDDIRARRGETKNPLGVPTGNLLLDNPNTYVDIPRDTSWDVFKRAAPKLPSATPLGEAGKTGPSVASAKAYADDDPERLHVVAEQEARVEDVRVNTVARKREELRKLKPDRAKDIEALTDDEVEAAYDHPAVKRARDGG